MVPVKFPIVSSKNSRRLRFWWNYQKGFFLACLPNNLLPWRWRLMVVLETWWPQDATFLCNFATVILGEFFASLIGLPPVRKCKINMGSLPGKFVTVLVALKFLSIALTADMGIFRRIPIFYSNSLTYEAQHTFLSFDLCVLYLSHVHVLYE